ncbi:dihydrodipicolinate synthase family protein [Steroidobacter sp.]|uniref:dihydrodipicolinate synthase family protein n=1 Tax=Steroidobacter sp. TaxID=1978227 RepID=UPI001A5EE05B|nr:dihydrodipicolinate synthase family protein [Steroidobacter sp.]MBL8270391.1 dihydrodipicolinate synthase family protein [Steroidobacter sp.]
MDRHSVQWRGYIPAITTPFTGEGALDLDALDRLLQWLHQEGMHGIIIGGTQGEWFTINQAERKQLMQAVGRKLGGKIPIIAGCSGYTSGEVAAHAKLAAEHGFNGILVTPPPYMVPTNREILAFYREVNDAVSLPICVYNWPPGTNVDMSLDLLREIAELSNVVAIKNSTADLRHFVDVLFALKDKVRVFGVPMNDLGILLVQQGADGTMGAGAVLGRELPGYFNAIWDNDIPRARQLGDRNEVLMRAWFNTDYTGRFGSAQAIFKAALNELGLPGGFPRRPLLPLEADGVRAVREILVKLGKVSA